MNKRGDKSFPICINGVETAENVDAKRSENTWNITSQFDLVSICSETEKVEIPGLNMHRFEYHLRSYIRIGSHTLYIFSKKERYLCQFSKDQRVESSKQKIIENNVKRK